MAEGGGFPTPFGTIPTPSGTFPPSNGVCLHPMTWFPYTLFPTRLFPWINFAQPAVKGTATPA